MALDLSAIAFKVDTSELDRAGKAIGDLVTNVGKLDKAARDAAQTEAILARAAKDNAKANLENAKAQDVRLKSTIVADKADQQAAAAIEKKTKATEKANEATAKSVGVLQKQKDILEFQTQGFSKGQSSILAYGKAAGLAADDINELGKVLETQRKLMGGDPFDKSLSGLKSLQNQYTELKESVRQYATDSNLSAKQTRELARDKERLIEKMKVEGASFSEIRKAVRAHNDEYVKLASSYNKMTSAEEAVIKARKDAVAATNYLTQADQKLAAALNTSNASLDKAGTDSLVKYETALRKSGLAQDVVVAKLATYKTQLTQVTALEKKRQEQHLARALSPQLTDIGVSLYSGQAPLTVLLQQGGQIADLLRLSGVEAQNFGKALRDAFGSMIPVIATVAKGLGGFAFGLLQEAGAGVTGFIGKITGISAAMDIAKRAIVSGGEENFKYIASLQKVGAVAATVAATGIAALIVGAGALVVALKQVTQEQNELVKSLNLTGAALGLNAESVIKFAQGIEGVKTTAAIDFIQELSNTSARASDNLAGLTKTAVDLEKYGGVALKDTAKAYEDLQKKPLEGLIKLAEGTGQVSQETIDLAVQLKLAGDEIALLKLVNEQFIIANNKAVDSIKQQINPMSALWITIKDGIGAAWEGMKNFARTGVVLETVLSVVRGVAKGILTMSTATQLFGKSLAMLLALAGNIGAALNPLSGVSFTQAFNNSKEVVSAYADDVKALGKTTSDAWDRINNKTEENKGITDAARAANSAYATDTMKGFSDLEKAYNSIEKAELKKITRQEAINKSLEDFKQKNKQASDFQLKMIAQAAGMSWDKANKSASDKIAKQTIKDLETEIDLRNKDLGLLASFNNELAAIERRRKSTGDEDQYQKSLRALIELQPIYKERQKEINAAHDLSNKLMGKADMLGKDYYKTLEQIQEFQDSGLYSPEKAEALRQAAFDQTELAKTRLKIEEDSYKLVEKYKDENEKALNSSVLENARLDDRLVLLGLTSEQQKELRIEQERRNKLLAIDLKLQTQIQDIWQQWGSGAFGKDGATKAKQAIIDLEQAAAEERKNINKEVAVQYAEDFMAEMQKIKSGITDSIVTALFEGGKAGSKKLRDVLVGVLRQKVTMVVDVGVNAFINSMLGGAVSSAAGSAGTSLLGSVATSVGGKLIAGSATTGLANLTGMLGGDSLGVLAAGSSGGFTSALGSAASQIPGWGWAIAGIAALAGLMSKKATPHAGAASTFSAAGGLQNINLGAANNMGFMANYAKETQGLTDQIAKTLVTALDSTAKSFGTTAGYAVSTAFADDTSKDGAWGQLIIQKLGKDLVNWGLDGAVGKWAPKEFGDGAEGQQQYMNAIAKSARDALKTAIGDVRWAQGMLDALGDSPTIEQLSATVEQITQAQSAITGLGKNIQGFANLTNDAISSLVEASGGAQAFFANMQSFYENFYSDAEKTANQSRDIAEALKAVGLSMPTTREGYRQLVEQQLSLGESGAKAAAELLKYSSVFASITQSQEDLAQAEQDRLQEAVDAYKDQQRDILQVQIDAANNQVDVFQRLFDFLDNEVKKLYGSVSSTAKMQVQQARAIIASALSTRSLPEQGVLEDAVGSITGSFSSGNYASKVDADRDRLKFAAQLDDLREIAGDSLNSAKSTFDLLKLQLAALEDQTLIYKQQLNGLYSIDNSVQDVVSAITSLQSGTGTSTGSTRPTPAGGSYGGVPGSQSYLNTQYSGPSNALVGYGSEEALSSFDKFKPWYQGLRSNAERMRPEDYETPDWLKVGGWAADASDEALFKAYLFYMNNPSAAADFQQIMQGGTSSLSTSGSTLFQTDLSKLPKEVADYYRSNPSALLMYEGFGMDPTLGYTLQTQGFNALGLNPETTNIATWLRNNKWTENGIVANNNALDYSSGNYGGYALARHDPQTGTIINIDGSIYTPGGKYLGSASEAMMQQLYGADFISTVGANHGYGSQRQSALYAANIAGGHSAEHYYSELKKNLDQFMTAGVSAQELANIMMDNGVSLEDAAVAYGVSAAEIAANLKNAGATTIPAFAQGGLYDGGVALVGENGPELINFNRGGYVHTASQTSAILSQGDTSQQLAMLNDKVAMLEAAARSTAISNNKIAKLLDRLSPDGDSLQVKTVQGSVTTTVP